MARRNHLLKKLCPGQPIVNETIEQERDRLKADIEKAFVLCIGYVSSQNLTTEESVADLMAVVINAWGHTKAELQADNGRLREELATMTETHDETLGAMQDLMDLQNGAPLIKWEKEWKQAMDRCRSAVKAARKGEVG